MKKFAFAVLALAVLVVGMAMADNPVNQTPETQGISSTTVVYCLGTVTESDAFVWQHSAATTNANAVLNGAPLADTERMSVVSYNEGTIADQGYTEYTKAMSLDTRNKVANQNNFKATKMVDFVTDELGYISTDESLLMDNAGQNTSSADRFICPFASAITDTIPKYCNIVEMGSSFDGALVSMMTDASERHVSATADTPVAMAYEVSVQPGVGTAKAWINAHIMEARGNNDLPSVDIVYNEMSTATGVIDLFYKKMDYVSGVRRA